MQSTFFNPVVVVYGHETLWFWSFGLNVFQGLTLNCDPDNLPVRQMVILIVPAEGRLVKVSVLPGSCDGWMVELGLDRDHMKPEECLSSPHWGTGPPPRGTAVPMGHGGRGDMTCLWSNSLRTLCEACLIIMLTGKPWPERLGCEGKYRSPGSLWLWDIFHLCTVVRWFQAACLGSSVGRLGESPLYSQ